MGKQFKVIKKWPGGPIVWTVGESIDSKCRWQINVFDKFMYKTWPTEECRVEFLPEYMEAVEEEKPERCANWMPNDFDIEFRIFWNTFKDNASWKIFQNKFDGLHKIWMWHIENDKWYNPEDGQKRFYIKRSKRSIIWYHLRSTLYEDNESPFMPSFSSELIARRCVMENATSFRKLFWYKPTVM